LYTDTITTSSHRPAVSETESESVRDSRPRQTSSVVTINRKQRHVNTQRRRPSLLAKVSTSNFHDDDGDDDDVLTLSPTLFQSVQSPTPYGLPFPKIGSSQPQPKTAVAIIPRTGKATDCKFGRYIQRVHPNKSKLKIW